MIRRISELFGSRLRMLSAAVAGAIALAGCATAPTDETAAAAGQASTPASTAATPASAPAAKAPLANSKTPPTTTVTLPDKGRVSLAEYRAQMRDQLMKSENASADVADCAAHASWVVPRSATYDALKIPTGALGQGQATEERWEGRFSSGKQAVPVSSVVTFTASAHKRAGEAQWQPVKVRCGYDNGMMLAYELLNSSGETISEPAAAPAVATSSHAKKKKGKGSAKATSSSSSKSGKASSTAKSTSSSKSSSSKTTTKKKQQ